MKPIINKLARIREEARKVRETEYPASDLSEFTPNIMRVGSRVRWTSVFLESYLGRTRDKGIYGGLMLIPPGFCEEGTIIAIHPTAPLITVEWDRDNDYFENPSKVLASNMAVTGSICAAVSAGECRSKWDGPVDRFKSEPELIRED